MENRTLHHQLKPQQRKIRYEKHANVIVAIFIILRYNNYSNDNFNFIQISRKTSIVSHTSINVTKGSSTYY